MDAKKDRPKSSFSDNEVPPNCRKRTKENPALVDAGLTDDSAQCRLCEADGDFIRSFRKTMQCRDLILEVKKLWADCDRKPLKELEAWEIAYAGKIVAEAEEMARECYRGDVVRDFEKLFVVSYDAFWSDLESLKNHFSSGA